MIAVVAVMNSAMHVAQNGEPVIASYGMTRETSLKAMTGSRPISWPKIRGLPKLLEKI